jgi:hypothetical protein
MLTGKAKRLKEAKSQAEAEIEQYRAECENAFKSKEATVCSIFAILSIVHCDPAVSILLLIISLTRPDSVA